MGLRAKFSTLASLGVGHLGQMVKRSPGLAARLSAPANNLNLTSPIVQVSGTISAEAATTADTRDIVLTLKDDQGDAINFAGMVELVVYASSAMLDWSAGGSTGLVQGTDGKLLALVAKKIFRAISNTSGVISLTYLDTATAAAYLGVRLPNGEVVGIGLLTTA